MAVIYLLKIATRQPFRWTRSGNSVTSSARSIMLAFHKDLGLPHQSSRLRDKARHSGQGTVASSMQ